VPRALWFLMTAVVLFVVVAATAAIVVQQWDRLNTGPVGGPFVMADTEGRRVTEADLDGKPTVLFFGYTACPDVCPATLSLLTSAMRRMGRDADRMNVIFATVDPARDTAAVLKDYLSSFDPRIRGLTGTEAQVAAMTAAFHIHRERVPAADGSYTMAHTANALLLNPEGKWIGEIFYGEDAASIYAKLATLAPAPVCRPGEPGPADLWAQQATFGPGRLCGAS
jgi:protein SCO1